MGKPNVTLQVNLIQEKVAYNANSLNVVITTARQVPFIMTPTQAKCLHASPSFSSSLTD